MWSGPYVSWNDKWNRGFVENVVVRVRQLKQYLVRARRKTSDDDRISTCMHPNPRAIVKAHMKVPNPRRSGRSTGAEHWLEMNVLDAILNDDHPSGGKRVGQRRIGDNLRWRFWGRKRDDVGEPALICYALCRRTDCESRRGSDHYERRAFQTHAFQICHLLSSFALTSLES
jgi:hypothetical protein